MYKFDYNFKTLKTGISFELKAKNRETIDDFNYDLFCILGDEKTKNIQALQQNQNDLAKKICEFLDKHKNNLPPEYNKIKAFFRNLEKDEYFIFLPNIPLTQDENFKLYNVLKSKTTGENLNELNEQYNDLFKELLDNYTLTAFGGEKISIGEKLKSKRVCRFCGKNSDETKFKNSAHAISEALGNKKILLNEECDSCNDKFSIEIEPDLIQFLTMFRSFYDIKGKGGSKKIKGKNFRLENEEMFTIKVEDDNLSKDKNDFPKNITLDFYQKINKQDIYRCLCKFFLSVLDKRELEQFEETIKWINKEKSISILPKVGQIISHHHFTKEPKIFTYLRKDDNFELPYAVGEFHFTCVILVFIVPLCKQDKGKFIKEVDFDKFWKAFKHYKQSSGWSFQHFSNDTEKKLKLNINFQMEKPK